MEPMAPQQNEPYLDGDDDANAGIAPPVVHDHDTPPAAPSDDEDKVERPTASFHATPMASMTPIERAVYQADLGRAKDMGETMTHAEKLAEQG